MKKIKVCFFAPSIYSLFNKESKIKFGGSEVQIYFLSKELSKNPDFKVSIITGNLKIKVPKIEYFKNIKICLSLPLKNFFFNYLKSTFIFFFYLKET